MVIKFQIDQVTPKVSRLRCITSQLIACMCPNLLLLDLGMAVSFATISVSSLLSGGDGIKLTEAQASWFGSIAFLAQPFGALLSGPIVDYYGRKKANFIVNIPHLVAWTLMYYAWNIPSLFAANCLLGLGTGIMEAPINSYVGEISEPSLRGSLCTITQVFASMGILGIYFLGAFFNWRNAALICLAVPILSMILVLVVPETPIWLLSRGRKDDALKSLQYLRGWTTADNVREEYDQLVEYSKSLKQCLICQDQDEKPTEHCTCEQMNFLKRRFLKLRTVMFGKQNLRPLTLVLMYFMFYTMSGIIPIRSNMENICGALGMNDDGKRIVLMVGVITFVTSILLIFCIKFIGKRKLAITSMFLSALSAVALSVYAKHYIPENVFSFNVTTFPKETSNVPLVLFYLMVIFNAIALPWIILSEVFPFRSRAIGQSIAAASNYIMMFISSKTLIDLETNVHLWGTLAVYAGFAFLGTIYLYFYLPETEGKTLQEIESFYSGKHRIFADDPFINMFRKTNR